MLIFDFLRHFVELENQNMMFRTLRGVGYLKKLGFRDPRKNLRDPRKFVKIFKNNTTPVGENFEQPNNTPGWYLAGGLLEASNPT